MNPIKKNPIQVNLPKETRIEAIMASLHPKLAKALQLTNSPQITISDCSIVSNGQYDTGINISGESAYDKHQEEYDNQLYFDEKEESVENAPHDETYEEGIKTFDQEPEDESEQENADEQE